MIKWDVLWELTKTEFKLKYAGTFMGFVWSLLKPLSMLGVLYVVFTYFFNNNIESYSLFLLLGILIWGYFTDATSDSMKSIKSNKSLLTKTNLSPSIIVMSSCLHSLMTFILNLIAFSVLFIISGKSITLLAILFIPLVIVLFLFSTAVSHILIILSSRFTDFKHIWEIIIQIGFWFTPIIYNVQSIPLAFQKIVMINPLAQLIEFSRRVIINNTTYSFLEFGILIGITSIVIIIAYWVYKKNKFLVVDNL